MHCSIHSFALYTCSSALHGLIYHVVSQLEWIWSSSLPLDNGCISLQKELNKENHIVLVAKTIFKTCDTLGGDWLVKPHWGVLQQLPPSLSASSHSQHHACPEMALPWDCSCGRAEQHEMCKSGSRCYRVQPGWLQPQWQGPLGAAVQSCNFCLLYFFSELP